MFNRKHLFQNINKNINYILKSDFLNFVRKDITERLLPLSGNFDRIITIRDHGNIISNALKNNRSEIKEIINIEDEDLLIHSGDTEIDPVEKYGKVNLIIFPFGLHFTNDVQGFLLSCSKILKEDGLLICNFASGGSLQNLRRYLVSTESDLSLAHSAYIAPLIKFDDVSMLLKQAHFIESIVDMEKLELEFSSPLDLMKAIKKSGCSNVFSTRKRYNITKDIFDRLGQQYKCTNLGDDFIDYVNLTSFIASRNKSSIKFK